MTFTQFTAFAAVAKHLNVTKAANMLHVSQPSLSKHLKALEENFSLRLFTRHAKGITLTGDGYEFLRDIEPILTQLEKINHRYLNGSAKKPSGSLRVGGTYGPASRILPSLLTVFKKTHPEVDVTLRANSNRVIHNLILNGTLELGVCSRAPRFPELCSEPYVSLKMVAFAAPNDALAKRKELSLSDLKDIPLIIRTDRGNQSTSYLTLSALRRQGYELNIAMRCESAEAIKRAVSQRLGIGFLYYDAVRDSIEQGSFKRVNIRGLQMESQTHIIYHNQRPLSPHAEEFLKLLRDWRDQQNTKSVKVSA
jgi:LysR family transcriptional regulator, transcriptional activator of the cysJI operon